MEKLILKLCFAFTLTLSCQAAIRLPWLFDDHMVVQQRMEIPVWGGSDPGSAVTISFAGESQKARAGADGRWMVRFSPLAASAVPKKMTITSSSGGQQDVVEINDILVGEVWLSAGQSNMWFPLKSSILLFDASRLQAL